MKYLKVMAIIACAMVFSSYDCGCSVDDGNGGNWTFWFNCDGSGDGLAEHFENSYNQYPDETHIVPASQIMHNC